MVTVATPTAASRSGSFVLPLYSLTLFLSAFLLFFVQPMFTKMVLPRLGGAPQVWNTAMVFFQATLLLGYGYAHLSARLLGLRRQAILHGAVLLLGLVSLPIGIGAAWSAPTPGFEVLWLIGLLAASVGLPFFAVSATAPLLQQWFAHTDHPAAGDPYFLYGASNIGSMLALLAYPVLIEPNIGVHGQSLAWTAGYALLGALIATCATLLWRRYMAAAPAIVERDDGLVGEVGWGLRLRWLLLAIVPSALLLGVTLHISTEIAAVPFLWVVPLALYLLTFVLVFARRPLLPHRLMLWLQVPVVAAVAGFYVVPHLYIVTGLHLLGLFVTAMVCHGELARLRPKPAKLTEFYLMMSLGGVIGGLLVAIVAPLVFNAVYEYPLTIVVALLLRPAATTPIFSRIARRIPSAAWYLTNVVPYALDLAIPAAFWWFVKSNYWTFSLNWGWAWVVELIEKREWDWILVPLATAYQPLIIVALLILASRRRLRFALLFGIVGYLLSQTVGEHLEKSRTFFGVYTVTEVERPTANYRFLFHGPINHGGQIVDQPRRGVTYYAAQGPVGQMFLARTRSEVPLRSVAVTGLGVGALACHVNPGAERSLTYFEIDPEVERLAREHFQYLRECGQNLTVEIGDGRLAMEKHADGAFDMVLLDAFAGDAIPAHLLTEEAFAMYMRKLSETGWLVVHITNTYLDLLPVVTANVRALGLVGRAIDWRGGFPSDYTNNSQWVVVARSQDYLGGFDRPATTWPVLDLEATSERPWTDDFSNLFRALRWGAGVFAH